MSIKDEAINSVGNIKYNFGSANIDKNGKGTADCSSFTEWLFKKFGIEIGRTTESQYSKGQKIDKKDLQEGDLVFFKNTYNSGYKDGVSHVGVYIGDGKFVHNSSGKGGTVISELNSSYYKEHYLGARRYDVKEGSSSSSSSNTTSPSLPNEKKEETKDIDLKWWGDILVTIITILIIGLAIVFFISAFNALGKSEISETTKKIIKKGKTK